MQHGFQKYIAKSCEIQLNELINVIHDFASELNSGEEIDALSLKAFDKVLHIRLHRNYINSLLEILYMYM